MTLPRSTAVLGAVGALLLIAAPAQAQPSDARTVFGITSNGNRLVSFPANNPGAAAPVTTTGAITGLGAGERVVASDFRPADNLLYVLTIGPTTGSGNSVTGTGRVYTVSTTTAAATLVSTLGTALSGAYFDMGFNPVANALRIVSSNGQNLRVTGAGLTTTVVDTALAYAAGDRSAGRAPRVAAADYTAAAGASTTLYDIDYAQDSLAVQGAVAGGTGNASPNSGLLSSVGATGLGVDVTNLLGFDIEADGTAYATAQIIDPDTGGVSPGTRLFTVSTSTGVATPVGDVAGDLLDSIAVDTTPLPPGAVLPEFPMVALAPLVAVGAVVGVRRVRFRRVRLA